ncbi:MAG: SPOR domain-containing protein [Thiotrichales bacterium]|nr:SPOR domain-containing protein [Thiotrichales bacterium]
MKKISLFLLAANLIIGLWLYTNINQSKLSAEKNKHDVTAQAEVIITLEEMEQAIELPPATEPVVEVLAAVENVVPHRANSDKADQKVASVEEIESESSVFADTAKDLKENAEIIQKNVQEKVERVVEYFGEVIDDIELPVTPTPHCYTLGPFPDDAGAESAAKHLQGQNILVAKSKTERHEPGGFWVYIPSDGLSSARKQIAELKRRGIEDVGLSTEQGVRHWVSLGVYSTKERARRRQVALSNISFYTRVEQRARKVSEYWIDITLSPEQDLVLVERLKLDNWPEMKQSFCHETGNL